MQRVRAQRILVRVGDFGGGGLDPEDGRNVVAFRADEKCSDESRAAISVALDVLNDFIAIDLADVVSTGEAVHADAYLPGAWQIGLNKTFMEGMATAMAAVTSGMSDARWKGPGNLAEELCLRAVLLHAIEVVPDIYELVDEERLKHDVMYLREVGFQEIDHEFLFEPDKDGIDKSDVGARLGMQSLSKSDAFKSFR